MRELAIAKPKERTNETHNKGMYDEKWLMVNKTLIRWNLNNLSFISFNWKCIIVKCVTYSKFMSDNHINWNQLQQWNRSTSCIVIWIAFICALRLLYDRGNCDLNINHFILNQQSLTKVQLAKGIYLKVECEYMFDHRCNCGILVKILCSSITLNEMQRKENQIDIKWVNTTSTAKRRSQFSGRSLSISVSAF